MLAPEMCVLHIPPFLLLKTPDTNLRSTREERPREEHSPTSPLFAVPKKVRRDDGRQMLSLPEQLSTAQERKCEQAALLDPSRQLIIGLFLF